VQIDDRPERIGLRYLADVGLVGDASPSMQMGDLATLTQERLPVKLVATSPYGVVERVKEKVTDALRGDGD
jgi:thiamine pyrophosphate-dependent acetolactate synthase large subunit-like protein